MFLWIFKFKVLSQMTIHASKSFHPFEFQLKWHNEWIFYLDLPFHLAKVLLKAAFQQKFLRRHKSRPDFVRFWCSSFGYSMQQLFIIKQKRMQNINHIYLYHITFYISTIYFYINPLLKFRVIETKTRVWYQQKKQSVL